ncbi:hypothetical protein FRB95_008535 [Tulasnella sp. JGI-2019a]|nr:hypothetical protein FRB93_001889 [Tulasnella sp. JGI-2019a]KAG9026729.1 hypothetical protein FRB95_008535 [Tulasnella sp. JGI-2019a]
MRLCVSLVLICHLNVTSNGTSYDRYYEGRKDFGALTSAVRNLSRVIWVQVVLPTPAANANGHGHDHLGPEDAKPHKSAADQLTAAKVRAIRLLLSFVYAAMHHLRNEPGVEHDDYHDVLPHDLKDAYSLDSAVKLDHETFLDRYATYSAINGGITTQVASSSRPPSPAISRPPFFSWYSGSWAPSVNGREDSDDNEPHQETPLLRDATVNLNDNDHTTVNIKPAAVDAFLPLPLVIAHELSMTFLDFKVNKYIEVGGPAGYNTMNTTVTGMVDQLTALERVATTPIPVSYGIHLKQCVTLYLFALPFTLVQSMHWNMVPLVTLVAFTLMGIEGIADEIEMPFGFDESDLPLERYCAALRSEVEYLIDRLPEGGSRVSLISS